MPSAPAPKAFTLLETMLVVLLVALLTTVAIPPFRQAQEALRFSALQNRVRSRLHETRILAVSRNQDCRLRVTSDTEYLIECQTPAWETHATDTLPAGYTVSATASPEFHPLGNVGPMATIRLENPEGQERRVIVSRSGRVRTE